jgi:hypothetical protein
VPAEAHMFQRYAVFYKRCGTYTHTGFLDLLHTVRPLIIQSLSFQQPNYYMLCLKN